MWIKELQSSSRLSSEGWLSRLCFTICLWVFVSSCSSTQDSFLSSVCCSFSQTDSDVPQPAQRTWVVCLIKRSASSRLLCTLECITKTLEHLNQDQYQDLSNSCLSQRQSVRSVSLLWGFWYSHQQIQVPKTDESELKSDKSQQKFNVSQLKTDESWIKTDNS